MPRHARERLLLCSSKVLRTRPGQNANSSLTLRMAKKCCNCHPETINSTTQSLNNSKNSSRKKNAMSSLTFRIAKRCCKCHAMPCHARPCHATPRSEATRASLIRSLKNSSQKKIPAVYLHLEFRKKCCKCHPGKYEEC